MCSMISLSLIEYWRLTGSPQVWKEEKISSWNQIPPTDPFSYQTSENVDVPIPAKCEHISISIVHLLAS